MKNKSRAFIKVLVPVCTLLLTSFAWAQPGITWSKPDADFSGLYKISRHAAGYQRRKSPETRLGGRKR